MLRDSAHNETALTAVSFVYNPNAANLTISQISNERISCSHVYRKEANNGTVSDLTSYADLMSFNVTSDQNLVEFKVAAFTTATYPEQNTSGLNITPIAAGVGSNGANYTVVAQSGQTIITPITVIIDGKDYRAALGGSDQTNVDGTHYVVVFGKNNAGIWSIAGTKVN